MPVECNLENRLLRVDITPPYSYEEVEAELRQVIESADFPIGTPLLVEILDPVDEPPSAMRRYATLLSSFRERIADRMAIVAPDDLTFGLARMFAAFAEPIGLEAQVFRDSGAAEISLHREPSSRETPNP